MSTETYRSTTRDGTYSFRVAFAGLPSYVLVLAPMKESLAAAPSGGYWSAGSRLVACAAVWCGIHCALTPLLVILAPALALSEGVERVAWVSTVLIGALMVGLGPARRKVHVILVFVFGAAVWAASLAGMFEPIPEAVTSATGSLCLAGALLLGARVCHSKECAVCDERSDYSR